MKETHEERSAIVAVPGTRTYLLRLGSVYLCRYAGFWYWSKKQASIFKSRREARQAFKDARRPCS